ncbi:hypothetical protein niasHT_034515 [Heterodera trifolii]|uniref:Uncharacterized protein n=1 Tax=Heterodera trifolii TaxID=157864 RepID=A0ABD2J401_9BILA
MDLQDGNKENKEPTKKADEDEDPSWISLIDEEIKPRAVLSPNWHSKKVWLCRTPSPPSRSWTTFASGYCGAFALRPTAHSPTCARRCAIFPSRCNDLSILDTHSPQLTEATSA